MRYRYTARLGLLLVLALGVLTGCSSSQATTSTSTQSTSSQQSSDDTDDDLKAYSEVITDEATTDEGLITTHRVGDKLYFEIPNELFGDELLMVSRIAKTATNFGYGGEKANTQVLRMERRPEKVLLRVVSYQNVANPEDPVYRAVQNSNVEPIIAAFDIEALNDDSTAVVVETTDLFTKDVPSLGIPQGAREQYRVRRLDGDRTYIDDVESFPKNLDIENVLTYTAQNPPSNESTNSLTVAMNHSLVQLPSDPMQPRLCDKRVGYFEVERTNYSANAQKAKEECFITRWRLEPSDPAAYARGELVEPKDPIVYYIDPATPEKWRPYLVDGVEMWNEAFRAAGFKNAIDARLPSEADSTFDPDDIRYSTIRYFASDVQNAYGPHVHDPRTGEILESDIGWYHNVMNLLRNWYFVQTAAANAEARGRTFDTEVMGKLIAFVAAHEVGHTIGLPHNWGSSYAVPVDSLRSPSYMKTHGTAPSIMDYARFNYVAQPGDGVTNFMPKIGIYDKWAIKWGYTDIEGSPEADTETLDEWVRSHAGDPYYFYGRQTLAPVDPRSQREDIGHDAVRASELGLANLKRTVPNLVEWTRKDGANYETLEELYGAVVNQWGRYLGHVGRTVGGVYETFKTYNQDGPVYTPVAREKQERAMQFLIDHGFATPAWLVNAEVTRRFEATGTMNRIREEQVDALNLILDPQRIARLLEAEAVETDVAPYPAEAMFADLRNGVWSELDDGEAIGPFRRNLQRGYLQRMHYLMTEDIEPMELPDWAEDYLIYTPVNVVQSDLRALVRSELNTLQDNIARALRRTSDDATEMHLRDALERIDRTLNPEQDA
ncbi:zinc-dependent metalloprotease [Salisaeta longa]|uniref:zinc-dependent metalloprotease n=1 Tax=Salisaeta longa TaxID=503170 RepID=UPI0003B34094|nr:zinc-dependent metalloprotease [Salisaeta longa]